VAVAACLLRPGSLPPARSPVAVVSGGNIDPGLLASILRANGGTAAGSVPAVPRGRDLP
jgi:hypothetical protein